LEEALEELFDELVVDEEKLGREPNPVVVDPPE